MVAVAVFRAIKKFTDYQPKIKWVNDIFVNGLKVSGILTEAVSIGTEIKYLVVGVGVNLVKTKNGFDESIKDIAGYLFEEKIDFANEFVSEIINQFFEIYNNGGFLDDYRNNSLLTGKKVTYIKEGVEKSGVVQGIDENCNLIVENNGKTELLFTGEVTITRLF
jgi:BirA family biotin operon repressor/biotin-[acetyl-CoA-carboxylase] ligase